MAKPYAGHVTKMSTRKLNDKELRFVDEYLIDLDPKRAALAAGYSQTMAASKAYQWVSKSKVKPHVYAAIREAQLARQNRTHITQDRVLQELSRLAFFDARKLFTSQGTPLDITSLDDDTAAAIAGVDIVIERTGEDSHDFATVRKYKVTDKLGALQAAMRHLGMFTDKVEMTGKNGGPVQHQNLPPDLSGLSDDELSNLEAVVAKLSHAAQPGRNPS